VQQIDAKRHLEAATGWLELGNYLEANAELDRLPPELRASSEVLLLRCCIYRKAERWEDLEIIADGAVSLYPRSERFYIHLGWARLKQGKIDECLGTVTTAAARFRNSAEVAYLCACHSAVAGMPKGAREWLLIALALDPSDRMKLRALGQPELESVWRENA
jgi:tetratricopeptide (TPR) repeat protein